MKYLKLHFTGILQYYSAKRSLVTSVSSVYYKTEKVPTKSAVVGMFGAVLGMERGDESLRKLYDDVTVLYHTVRAGSVIEDFQTVRPSAGQKFAKVGGGKKDDGIIKTVEYLQDAEFDVYVGADESLLKQIYDAFQNPVYMPYFGRRCCVPSEHIVYDYELLNEEDLADVYECP